MLDFLKRYLAYPLARFAFEWLGDHPWALLILALLIAGAIWKWCLPWLRGFYALFGWQGILLALAGLLSLGAFGAGWRAHRDSIGVKVPEQPPIANPKKPKPNSPTGDGNLDDYLKRVFKGR